MSQFVMPADLLREKFLAFFKAKRHRIIESDSLLPKADPTVLFTPAGMNQFKRQFMGEKTGFTRAATSQRCLRTDDLDKVGKSVQHHTFFEMLGNFSFGDYFKDEAIAWAWEFLTQELKIDPGQLWVSVYQDDEEAYKIWRDKIKLPENKIVKLGDKENFWPSEAKAKGPNGPCGPCSEIFYDFGKGRGCRRPECSPACGCGRFSEVWNLVFTQFNRKEDGVLEPLPQKNIDTGMGLERLAALMQGVENNFETDLFRPIIAEIERGCKLEDRGPMPIVYALADHIRAIVFAVYDGILPSNDGRGYVVRKLIRKSVLHLRSLGMEKPFLFRLVPAVAEAMKTPYPQLSKRQEDIAQVIQAEEKRFISVLRHSGKYLQEAFPEPGNLGSPAKAAGLIFRLTDTYGLPLEIILGWLEDKVFLKDESEKEILLELYNDKLREQRVRSQQASAMKGEVFSSPELKINAAATKFIGYKKYSSAAVIRAIIKSGAQVNKAVFGEEAQIILDKTPFYPESGGQIGDCGWLQKQKNIFEVSDTQKSGKFIVHLGRVKQGSFKQGDKVTAEIDNAVRLDIARNHTATHLLQAALRSVLGAHVQQQGSLVAGYRLRFDFSHFQAMNDAQLARVEEFVNSDILQNLPIVKKEMTLTAAKKSKALAFFAEKYEDKVRVVSIGGASRELCGGTHLDYTGQIGMFRILHESSVASGIRRIEAVTGSFAFAAAQRDKEVIRELSEKLTVPAAGLTKEVEKRLLRITELEKQLAGKKLDSLKGEIDAWLQSAEEIKGVKFVAKILPDTEMDLLRKNVDLIREKSENTIVALASAKAGKAMLVLGISADLAAKGKDAVALIRQVCGLIGGSGGGRSDFAQAGGNRPQNLGQALAALKKIIAEIK